MIKKWPLGVFASLDTGDGVSLDVAHELGVSTIHLHAPSPALRSEAAAKELRDRLGALELTVTVVFASFTRESYADIPTVKQTVGLVPSTTREARLTELKEIIVFTELLGADTTGLHIGYIPHDSDDGDYSALVTTIQQACDFASVRSVSIHLETGQEPAHVLLEFLQAVDRPNLFVNFDPANMILYGCGEPLPALKTVGPYVRSVHCKDAEWSDQPGVTWGEETRLGEGDVNISKFVKVLNDLGYQGPLTIEREISNEPARQKAEIAESITLLQRLKATYINASGSQEATA